mgnify:CR=1 FL=1
MYSGSSPAARPNPLRSSAFGDVCQLATVMSLTHAPLRPRVHSDGVTQTGIASYTYTHLVCACSGLCIWYTSLVAILWWVPLTLPIGSVMSGPFLDPHLVWRNSVVRITGISIRTRALTLPPLPKAMVVAAAVIRRKLVWSFDRAIGHHQRSGNSS